MLRLGSLILTKSFHVGLEIESVIIINGNCQRKNGNIEIIKQVHKVSSLKRHLFFFFSVNSYQKIPSRYSLSDCPVTPTKNIPSGLLGSFCSTLAALVVLEDRVDHCHRNKQGMAYAR